MTVLPKAIDKNGKTVQNNAIVNALFHPNLADSVVSFSEKIAVSTLVLPKTYLLVWRNEGGVAKPGGDFGARGSNIAGFTFLERPGITRRDGKTYYNVGAQEFSENEVIVLPGGVNPHSLYDGYSPTEASVKWITLDGYIADFQKGFFENNAIPSGMFVITAPSVKEYEDIVTMLQSRHRGAGNNNNVTYSHKPIDKNTGKPAEAQIEWIPFQQSNKDIDFKSLFQQANSRIDQAYGVSQFIKGVDDAPNYATAQVSEANFSKRAVKPLLMRNYAQITHELNRITGGLGIAITFTYAIPAVADQEKVEAETNKLNGELVTLMVEKGYTVGSVVDAFDLPKRLKLLSKTDDKSTIENDKPEVDDGKEVVKSPDPDKIDGVTPLNELHCSACDRFLGTTDRAEATDKLKCSNSKCRTLAIPVVKSKQLEESTDE
jgi:phage portal protein BeeE